MHWLIWLTTCLMLIAPWWGWRSRTSHLLVELQHSIPRLRRVLLFITRQFDPGNACFTYRQINSIALTENWARNCAQFFIGRKQVGGEKCPLLLTISSLSSREWEGGGWAQRGWLEKEKRLGRIRIDSAIEQTDEVPRLPLKSFLSKFLKFCSSFVSTIVFRF